MTTPFTVLIPARYGATRLPGKPLRELAGKPLIQHVHERALESGAQRVVIATDDARIHEVCLGFGATVCITSPEHPSGTDRLADAARQLNLPDDEIVVNLQGDEPLMPPELLARAARNLYERPSAQMATACVPIDTAEELFNPNAVKVVCDKDGFALYFSRAPIPWHRESFAAQPQTLPTGIRYFRHLGLYAYRAGFLARFVQWPPAPLERVEALEQLRALWNGQRIYVDVMEQAPPAGVDTLDDLNAAEAELLQRRLRTTKHG